MKYVMFKIPAHGEMVERFVPIIFPNNLVHKDVADRIQRVINDTFDKSPHCVVVSAGEINLTDVTCHGDSETLKVKSRGLVDEHIIELYDYMHGIA